MLGRVNWKVRRHLQAFVGHKAVVLTAHSQAGCAKPLEGVGAKEQCSQCPHWSGVSTQTAHVAHAALLLTHFTDQADEAQSCPDLTRP